MTRTAVLTLVALLVAASAHATPPPRVIRCSRWALATAYTDCTITPCPWAGGRMDIGCGTIEGFSPDVELNFQFPEPDGTRRMVLPFLCTMDRVPITGADVCP